MKYKDVYFELKKAMLLLNKKHAFEKFNAMNFFFLMDEHSKGILVFNNQSFEDSLSISLYFGDEGLSYLVDSYTSNTGVLHNAIFANMIVLSLFKRKYLVEEDFAYFKRHKIKMFQENNFLPCEFKEGYPCQYLSIRMLKKCLTYLYYVMSLIDNELENMEEEFKAEKVVLAGFDTQKFLYEINYVEDIPMAVPSMKRIDFDFVEEYKSATYVDDVCYIGRYFEPIKKDEDAYFDSLFIALYEKNGKRWIERISCKPNQFLEYCKGFLDTLFKEYGVPTKIVFNHRRWMAYLLKTLLELHIEVEFQREPDPLDQIFLEYLTKALEETEEGEKRTNVLVS